MPAHHKPRLGRPDAVAGVTPGGTRHKILLALRAPGGLTTEQMYERFGGATSGALGDLKRFGLITMGDMGQKDKPIRLTAKAAELTHPDGPLNRRTHLITYC